MKIGVHFNCQTDGIAVALRALLPGAEVINYLSDANLPEHEQAARAAALNACDYVVAVAADGRHGLLSGDALRRSARHCVVLPGFAFAGYHPDMVYLRSDGRMLPSATGEYHSRIAVAGYLAGLDARETAGLYNKLVFSRLGYFTAFEEQAALFCAMWARYGIDAAPLITRWSAQGCFVHTINHPKMIVLLTIARIACDRMGLPPANPDVDWTSLPDNLGRGPMHPLFADIAAALGIAPEGQFTAGMHNNIPVVFTPVQFVTDCFGHYATTPIEDLRAADGVASALTALGAAVRARPPRPFDRAMVLMTHHGSLLRQGPSRGQLSHAPLAVPEWELAYLRADCAVLPAAQDQAGIKGAIIAPAAADRRVVLSRAGAFLSAELQSGQCGFTRTQAGEWERFLPLDQPGLALLQRLTGNAWLIEDTQNVVPAHDVAIEAGPILRFGAWRIDLARHFPTGSDGAVRLILDGIAHSVREHAPPEIVRTALPEPGRTLGLVGAPVFLAAPLVADAADLVWMRRSAVAAQALDGAPQATQALLRRQAEGAIAGAAGLSVRFCAPPPFSAASWTDAAVRLHVLAAVAPPGATYLVPPHVPPEAVEAWRALGFAALTFHTAEPEHAADLLWLDNASIAELPADALAGCRSRIGTQPGPGRKLLWLAGLQPQTAIPASFEPLDPAALTIIAGVALPAHASWIIGRTGHVPLMFCQPGTRVIELCDKAGFVQDDWVLSAKLGLRHAILPCAAVDGDLVPDSEKLARLLTMMAASP